MCCSVVSKRYLDRRDGTHTGRAHHLVLQQLREDPPETGQSFRAHHPPKGCDRFLSLSAGPVHLSPLTGRYDHYSSSPGTGGPVCRQAGRLRDDLARGVSPRSLCAMPGTHTCLTGGQKQKANGHPCAGNGWPMLCCRYPLHCQATP